MSKGRCPLCESRISVAEFKPLSRLSCGKCHANLHVSREGRLAVGDPTRVDDPLQDLKRDIRRAISGVPVGKIVTWLAVIVVIGLAGYQFFGPAEQLDLIAEKAGKALAEGDPKTLKALADPESVEDVQRWYDAVHLRLDQYRKDWVGKTEVAEVKVTRQDPEQRKGSADLSIHPDFTGARDVSLADPASSTATASSSMAFEETTEWTLTKWGRWKLDGKALAARLPKDPSR